MVSISLDLLLFRGFCLLDWFCFLVLILSETGFCYTLSFGTTSYSLGCSTRHCPRKRNQTAKTAPLVKVLIFKAGNLALIPGTHMVQRERRFM